MGFPLATEAAAWRTRAHPVRRLIVELGVGYLAAWIVGMGFGFALSRTESWRLGAHWERVTLIWLHAHPQSFWVDQAVLATPYIGTNLTILPAVIVLGLVLWLKYQRPLVAVQLLVVCVGSLSLNPTMKHLLDRPRPTLFQLRGMWTWAAYPSGHLILTTALYFTIAGMLYRERGWRWPFVVPPLIILFTSYGRLYLAVHWPTDLIGGLLIGIVWLIGTWLAFDRFNRREERDVDVVTSGR